MVRKIYKDINEMMMSPEWSATDKIGREAMLEDHGFLEKTQIAAKENQKPRTAEKPKTFAPSTKSLYQPGVVGKGQRMVQKPFRLGELVDALDQNKEKE